MAEEVDDSSCAAFPPPGDQVMELLWHNGQVVPHGKRRHKKSDGDVDHRRLVDSIPSVGSPPLHLNHHDPDAHHPQQNNDISNIDHNNNNNNNLFIQEDEMATWLFSDFCSDLLLPPSSTTPSVPAPPPPPSSPRGFETFRHFSRLNHQRSWTTTAVDSSDSPMVLSASAGRHVARARDSATCDRTVTLSSAASSASTDPIPPPLPSQTDTTADTPVARKGLTTDDSAGARERHDIGEDVRLLSKEGKRPARGSSSSTKKRSRAAEVHNLSERRRRDRINEKMRALQELIPHCNKADKASMLDEAIEYLKSLQMQIQMLSMGCGMMPMMYPYRGVQQYMQYMGMGMGLGMGMEMGMNRPVVPFPHVFPGSMPPTGGPGPPMCQRFRFSSFQIPSNIPAPNPSGVPNPNHPGSALSPVPPQNPSRMPRFVDPYQHLLGLQHVHSSTSSSGMATTNKAGENSEKSSPD